MSDRSRPHLVTRPLARRTLALAAVLGLATTAGAAAGHDGSPQRPHLSSERSAASDAAGHDRGVGGASIDSPSGGHAEPRLVPDPETASMGLEPGAPSTTADSAPPGTIAPPASPPPTSAAQGSEPQHPPTTAAPTSAPTSTALTSPAPTAPASTAPVPTAPASTAPAPLVDTPVPQTITLACTWSGVAEQNAVSCSWTGSGGVGFSRYLVLRGQVGSNRGRVLTSSTNASGGSFSDGSLPLGSFSYVVVAMDANDHNIGHSNPVFVDVPAASPPPLDPPPLDPPPLDPPPTPADPTTVPAPAPEPAAPPVATTSPEPGAPPSV